MDFELPEEIRLLKDTVKAGRMGMKTGAGWYDYPRK